MYEKYYLFIIKNFMTGIVRNACIYILYILLLQELDFFEANFYKRQFETNCRNNYIKRFLRFLYQIYWFIPKISKKATYFCRCKPKNQTSLILMNLLKLIIMKIMTITLMNVRYINYHISRNKLHYSSMCLQRGCEFH